MRRRSVMACILGCCIFSIMRTASAGPTVADLAVARQVFPVLGQGAETCLAVGMMIASYPEGATVSVLRKDLEYLPEDKWPHVPEVVILKQYDFLVARDEESLNGLYLSGSDEMTRIAAPGETTAYARPDPSYFENVVTDISFLYKAEFGPYVYLYCKPLVKEGLGLAWASIAKKTEEGYRLIRDPDYRNIFPLVAAAFPYWMNREQRLLSGSMDGFLQAAFRWEGAGVQPPRASECSSDITLYYQVAPFSASTLLVDTHKRAIRQRLDDLVKGYHAEDFDAVTDLWLPGARERVRKGLSENQDARNSSVPDFQGISRLEPRFLMGFAGNVYVYATPISTDGEQPRAKLFTFQSLDDEWYFSDLTEQPLADRILRSTEFANIIEKHLTCPSTAE